MFPKDKVEGCMDSTACNYDSTATCDDSSCLTTFGCMDSTACNYDSTATCEDGSCSGLLGCTDSTALNYNISATISDSLACEYENTTIYSMPSVILGSNVEISIYNNLSFNDINIIPDDLEWSSDTNITSYEQEYEVLHYNMNFHQIVISTNNYIIREINKLKKEKFEPRQLTFGSGFFIFLFRRFLVL